MKPNQDYVLSVFDVPEEHQQHVGRLLQTLERILKWKCDTHYASRPSVVPLKREENHD
jgi:hypothetical protein